MTDSSTIHDKTFTEEEKSTEHVSIPLIKLNKHEESYLVKQRNALWIANPKMLYTFGASPKSNLYIFGQTILLLLSLSIFFAINFYTVFAYKEVVVGVGEISGQTWVDRLTILATLFILFKANKHLKNNVHKNPIKGYRLTMFSNGMMRALINQIKLIFLIFILSASYGLMAYKETSQVFTEILNGSFADNLVAIVNIVNLIITYQAFHFCKKELEQ